jgi:hypothetical protein
LDVGVGVYWRWGRRRIDGGEERLNTARVYSAGQMAIYREPVGSRLLEQGSPTTRRLPWPVQIRFISKLGKFPNNHCFFSPAPSCSDRSLSDTASASAMHMRHRLARIYNTCFPRVHLCIGSPLTPNTPPGPAADTSTQPCRAHPHVLDSIRAF